MSEWRSGCLLLFSVRFIRLFPHSVVVHRRMKWTTELGQPNEENCRKH